MINNFLNKLSEDGDGPSSRSGIGADESGLGMSNSKRNKKAFEGYLDIHHFEEQKLYYSYFTLHFKRNSIS